MLFRSGLGFVLQQKHGDKWQTVQTGSRFLSDTESRYAVIELEMLGVAWSIHKCKYFLSGLSHFEIITDHNPFIPILNSHRLDEIENPRLQRLRTRIMGYNFTARHIKGKDNDAPDALSRYPTEPPKPNEELAELEPHADCYAMSTREIRALGLSSAVSTNDEKQENLHVAELREHAQRDDEYKSLRKIILEGFPDKRDSMPINLRQYWKIKEHTSVDDDLILFGVRLFVPESLRATLLSRMHEAHQGIGRMQERARLALYWPGIDEAIENFVRGCRHCSERQSHHQKEPLVQKPRPERPFQQIAMDYAEKDGHKFLIVVDCKTDWPDIIHCKNRDTSTRQLIKDLRGIFCRTAVPDIIWTDHGPQFTSGLLHDFLKDWGVRHIMSSPKNPQSNGKAEATVKSMKNIISNALKGRIVDEEKLAKALLQYRNTPNRRDGLSPAQKLYGRQVQDTLPVHRRALRDLSKTELVMAEERALLHDEKAAKYYNMHSKTRPDLEVGQLVAVFNESTKRWNIYGKIVEKISSRRYMIKTRNGIVLTRNKKYIRARLPLDLDKHNDSDAIEATESGAAIGMMKPQENPDTEGALQLSRPRRKPERLIEDDNWH